MRVLMVFWSLLALAGSTTGQGYTLSGKVLDDRNEPLAGATIVLNDGAFATTTDADGVFELALDQEGRYSLSISFIGFKTEVVDLEIPDDSPLLVIRLEQKAEQLDEVVIHDDRSETLKREEALNVEVVNREFISRNLSGSLMKTIERLPGVSTISIGSGLSKPVIRGLAFNRVVVAENGVKHQAQQWGADHGLEIDQYAVERIEVVKGPASFRYGSDAIGGVIDVKRSHIPPENSLGGSFELTGKSNNGALGGSVDLFGRKKRLFFNTRFTRIEYGDYRVPADYVDIYSFRVPLKNRRLRNTAGRETGMHVSAGYVGNRFNTVFHLSRVTSKNGFFANAHGLEPRMVDTLVHDQSDRDVLQPFQEVDHLKLINNSLFFTGNHKIHVELGYQHNFRQEFSDYVSHGYMPAIFPDTLGIPIDLEREFDLDVYSFNARDELMAGRHTLNFGFNAEYQENRIGGWSFIIPAFDQFSGGVFLYDKFVLTENVILHAGIRYDYGNINTRKSVDWFPSLQVQAEDTVAVNLQRAGKIERTFNSMSWAAGVNYNLEHFSLKSSVGKSFRMPIAKELAANGVNYHHFSYERGDADLSAEESYQADLSLEWNFSRWAFQISPFINFFPNYIYLNPTAEHDYLYGAGNQVFCYTQSEVLRFGGEIHSHVKLTKRLKTGVIGEYLYSEQLSGEKAGFSLPFTPPASLLFNLSYFPNTGKSFVDSYVSVDFRMVDKQDRIVPPERKTPGYEVLNLALGTKLKWGEQELQMNVQVQNVLNAKYFDHTSFYRLINVPEPGRNVVVNLKIPFDLKKN